MAGEREPDDQLTKIIREFLLTLRSLIDWYLERLDTPGASRRSRRSRSTEARSSRLGRLRREWSPRRGR